MNILCLRDIIPLHMMWRCQTLAPGYRFEAQGEPVKVRDFRFTFKIYLYLINVIG